MSDISLLFKDKAAAEVKQGAKKICSLIKDGKLPASKVSIRDLADSLLGEENVKAMMRTEETAVSETLREGADPVNLQMFSNITGTLVYQGVVESYRSPEFIGDSLVSNETSTEDNTRVTGLAPIDDNALVVEEGKEFPSVKFGEDYIDVPKSQKRGLKIAVTRELIFFDKTSKVMEMAQGVGARLGMDREKRILRVVLGISNPFSRKGVARNTYVAAGDPRINKVSNPLTDWTDIDDAMALFTAMVDDRTVGEPIMVDPTTIIASQYKEMTIKRILNATDVRTTTNTNTRTDGANPLTGKNYNVVTSPLIDWLLINEGGLSAANAKQYWHFGNPKRAFMYRTLFPLGIRTAPANDIDEFERDIVLKFRADERGVAYVKEPWQMVQNTN